MRHGNTKCLLFFAFIFWAALIFGQEQNHDSTLSLSRKFTLDSCITTFDSLKVDSTKAGYQFWFVTKDFLDGRTIKLSHVLPGKATHPPHRHNEDEFFFVLEGEALLFLNGATRKVGPMTSFYCPSGSEHGIANAGLTDLRYLVIKKYNKAL